MTDAPALRRLPDWRSRLTVYIGASSHVRFRPGKHDCALFTAGAVEAMTGADLARGWRGYRTLKEGERRLKETGHEGLDGFVAAMLPEVAPAFAQVGDVAMIRADGDTGVALGIVQGEGVYVVSPSGLAVVSRMTMERAFRV